MDPKGVVGYYDANTNTFTPVLSRRDLFAAAALTGLLARPADERPDSCVESAWLYAREMLANEPKE